ncbi:MAG: T9SS type A sorting domain-containing protein [Ignavibacteriae bacterium]|nr:T9SS C-terminal target domain-containing protein [Ignavibacteriota bacterium]NOG98610.1 T9SS type A sorting domain-containing protein [Ignavibacteriota bacterium]
MKRFLSLAILISLTAVTLNANSIDSTNIGPGVVHYHEYRAEGPWHLNIIKIDLENEWIKIETVKANDKLKSLERASSMAARNDAEEHRIVGGTNGDFYAGDGSPIGTQIINGEILKSYNNWQTIGFDINNLPMIDNVNFYGQLIAGDSIRRINNVNDSRSEDYLTLYNNFFGSSTATNIYGSEALLTPISEWLVNDTVTFIIDNFTQGQNNLAIPNGKVVLSGHGTAQSFMINNFTAGDTVKMVLTMTPGLDKLKQLIGGNAKIVNNGVSIGETGDRHPRTSIGFDSDSTTLYMFTVDGRQPGYSIGMTLRELSDYMVEWGVYQGLNLDGGGSTTMIARGNIKNSPSDPGGERSVSNGIFIVSTAPDDDLAHLGVFPREAFVTSGSTLQFTVEGYDQYYNYVTLSPGSVIWSCDPSIGTISSAGLYTAAADTLTGYVYAEVNGVKDSSLVRMTQLVSVSLEPNPVILELGEFQQMIPQARDNYNNIVDITITDYNWSVTGDVGTISTSGLFTTTAEGEGTIVAEYNGIEGVSPVTVGVSTAIIVDDFSTVSNFSLTGVNVNLPGCSFTADAAQYISAPTSGKLTYDLTTGGTSALYMNCSIPISGTPDKVGINVYGDGKGHWLRGEFNDSDNEKFIVDFTSADPGINWTDSWEYLEVNLDDAIPSWANPNALLNYPITWKKIYLVETSDDKKDQGAIYFDDFQVDFIVTDVNDSENEMPTEFRLEQNYPNPFNPTTKIRFTTPPQPSPYQGEGVSEGLVTLKIYDVLGNEIATLINEPKPAGNFEVEFNAANLPSGVYFYRLSAGSFVESKKMVLLK